MVAYNNCPIDEGVWVPSGHPLIKRQAKEMKARIAFIASTFPNHYVGIDNSHIETWLRDFAATYQTSASFQLDMDVESELSLYHLIFEFRDRDWDWLGLDGLEAMLDNGCAFDIAVQAMADDIEDWFYGHHVQTEEALKVRLELLVNAMLQCLAAITQLNDRQLSFREWTDFMDANHPFWMPTSVQKPKFTKLALQRKCA